MVFSSNSNFLLKWYALIIDCRKTSCVKGSQTCNKANFVNLLPDIAIGKCLLTVWRLSQPAGRFFTSKPLCWPTAVSRFHHMLCAPYILWHSTFTDTLSFWRYPTVAICQDLPSEMQQNRLDKQEQAGVDQSRCQRLDTRVQRGSVFQR